jgi:hypothetical protein
MGSDAPSAKREARQSTDHTFKVKDVLELLPGGRAVGRESATEREGAAHPNDQIQPLVAQQVHSLIDAPRRLRAPNRPSGLLSDQVLVWTVKWREALQRVEPDRLAVLQD